MEVIAKFLPVRFETAEEDGFTRVEIDSIQACHDSQDEEPVRPVF